MLYPPDKFILKMAVAVFITTALTHDVTNPWKASKATKT
jgi:hypothetical protein